MSLKTLCIWIIIAGILGGIALGLHSRLNSQTRAAALVQDAYTTLGIDTSRIQQLRVEHAGQIITLEQASTQQDQWDLHWTTQGVEHYWPAGSPKVNSGLRALATERIARDDSTTTINSNASIRIEHTDGRTIRVEFDQQPSGGRRHAQITERNAQGLVLAQWTGKFNDSLYQGFVERGVLDWRSHQLFPMALNSLDTIHLKAGPADLALNRINGRWMITSPYRVHADQNTVHELAKSLLGVQADSFVDEPIDPDTFGLTKPTAIVAMSSNDESSTLKIGTRADVGGDSVFAEFTSGDIHEAIVISTEQLAKLTAVAQPYISTKPSMTLGSQVQSLQILGKDHLPRLRANRSGVDWLIDGLQADQINREAIERLLLICQQQEAAGVQVITGETSITPLGTIELIGRNTEQLDSFEIAIDSTETGLRLLLIKKLDETNTAYWICNSDEAVASGAWLTAVAGKRIP